jgi:hypothetical protein
MITEAAPVHLSAGNFEDLHVHAAHMIDSNEYIDQPGVIVDRHVMKRTVSLLDRSASIGGSPIGSIPEVHATVKLDQGNYVASAYDMGVLGGHTEIIRTNGAEQGEYRTTIENPRAAVLVASLAAKAIERGKL